MSGNGCSSSDALTNAMKSARREEIFEYDGWKFTSVSDHILPSTCTHQLDNDGDQQSMCQVCHYASVLGDLPQFPEMIFPNNTIRVERNGSGLEFNALDALRLVESAEAPQFKVGASAQWTSARQGIAALKNTVKPFDWTYTTTYPGTIKGFTVTPTDERIDLEKLKRRDPIQFYAQTTLFEDELADHGCSSLTLRLRVMPSCFFVLQRFYLRVDDVLVRLMDTRIYGELGKPYLLREWCRRESLVADMQSGNRPLARDPNIVWTVLPQFDLVVEKLVPL